MRATGKTVRSHGLAAVLLAGGIAASAPSGASAQLLIETLRRPAEATREEAGEIFRDWRVRCDETCVMEPLPGAYSGGEGARRLYGRLIDLPGQSRPVPVFAIDTPLEYLLPKGVSLRVDGGAVHRLAFRTCRATGCFVPFRLDPGLARALRRGRAATLTLTRLDGTEDVATVSLMGFTSALESLIERQ